MSAALKDQVLATLRQIAAPGTGSDVMSAGMVSDVFVSDGRVMFSLSVPASRRRRSSR